MAEKTRKQLLEEKINYYREQLKKEDAKEKEALRVKAERDKKAKRKWETNQKVRVGAAVISEELKHPEKKEELLRLLDSFYREDYDRKYFVEWGLSPQHKSRIKPAPVGQENTSAPLETETAPAYRMIDTNI